MEYETLLWPFNIDIVIPSIHYYNTVSILIFISEYVSFKKSPHASFDNKKMEWLRKTDSIDAFDIVGCSVISYAPLRAAGIHIKRNGNLQGNFHLLFKQHTTTWSSFYCCSSLMTGWLQIVCTSSRFALREEGRPQLQMFFLDHWQSWSVKRKQTMIKKPMKKRQKV